MLKDLFKKFKLVTPAERGMYAVNTGLYVGEFLVFISADNSSYNFLSLPRLYKRSIPKDKFEIGIKNKIITLVEILPKKVFAYCAATYKSGSNGMQHK